MLEVWSWPTPNGHKVHIALEELGLQYKVIPVNIGAGDQFKPEFLAITPNHRIPAIVDPDGPGGKKFTLFESAAIMIYLSEKSGGKLIPKDPVGRYKCLEWMMFQMGGVGPMFGQWNHFAGYAPEKIPYAIERYANEVKRLSRVLNHRLDDVAVAGRQRIQHGGHHHLPVGPYRQRPVAAFCRARLHRSRRLPGRQALARCDLGPAGGAARSRGARRQPSERDHRPGARGLFRQDPVPGAVTVRVWPPPGSTAPARRVPGR